MKRLLALVTAACTVAVTCIVLGSSSAHADAARFQAKLRDPDGRVVGSVTLRVDHHAMHVQATLRPNANVEANQFHGFHIHANNDPANGNGCRADSSEPSSTWFVSADGHLSATGQEHGEHNGDLPSPLVMADGTARLAFSTDRIDPEVLRGRAVILHKLPDNYGNIPVGSEPNQYRPNSPAATDLTARTGNASDRMACGLIRRDRYWF